MSTLNDLLRRFDERRRRWTTGLELAVLAWLGRRSKRPPRTRQPQRILVIRSTRRIGNNLFLLPFLQKVRSAHPDARLELVCRGPQLLPFVADLKLEQVYQVSLQGAKLFRSLPLLWQLHRQTYDRIYVPFTSSTDHLLAAWIPASEKLGFDERLGNTLFAHPQRPDPHCHFAHQPLQLLGGQAGLRDPIRLGSVLDSQSPALLALRSAHPDRPLVGFFTGARKGKGLASEQWQRLLLNLRRYQPAILLIQIGDPAATPLPLGDITLTLAQIPALACFTRGLQLFISCDTGPLHLAAASGVPCLGLFTRTDPARYGCLGARHLNLVVTDPDAIPLDHAWLAEVLGTAPAAGSVSSQPSPGS